MSRRVWIAGLLVPLVAFTAPPQEEPGDVVDSSLEAAAITRDGDDTYSFTVGEEAMTVEAPEGNGGGNTRMIFWPRDDPETRNHESCATWDDRQADHRQQGAALRVRPHGDGYRAIIVSKNIWDTVYWVFNVHLVDTTSDRPVEMVGRFYLDEETFVGKGSLVPDPWRLCARAVGDQVRVKIWPLIHPEPEWGDPVYGGSLELPDGWDVPGRAGWYMGHLWPGDTATFSEAETTGSWLRYAALQLRSQLLAGSFPDSDAADRRA